MRSSSGRTPYGTTLKYLPEKLSGWPCVRCPPWARFMPRIVSPGLSARQEHRHVRLGARVRLHVRVLGAEQRLRARDGERFDDVDVLAAAVVAPARIALGVLVREDRAGRLEHGGADEVLRGDQLQPGRLPCGFVRDGPRNVGIHVSKRTGTRGQSSSPCRANCLYRVCRQLPRSRPSWSRAAERIAFAAGHPWIYRSDVRRSRRRRGDLVMVLGGRDRTSRRRAL